MYYIMGLWQGDFYSSQNLLNKFQNLIIFIGDCLLLSVLILPMMPHPDVIL